MGWRGIISGLGILVALAGWWFFRPQAAPDLVPFQPLVSFPYYQWCPVCNFELPFHNKPLAGARCPHCDKKNIIMEVTTQSHKQAVGAIDLTSSNPWVPIGVFGTAGFLALALMVISFCQRRESTRGKEAPYHCHCPGCGCKIGYRGARAKHRVLCPKCRAGFVFPDVPTKGRGSSF